MPQVARAVLVCTTTPQAAGASLLSDRVPGAWEALWDAGPESPSDYIRAVVARGLAVEQWWAKSQAGTLLNSGGARPCVCVVAPCVEWWLSDTQCGREGVQSDAGAVMENGSQSR